MGLIKTIFGAIFGLIGGIFKAIGGIVGLGKKSEFYLEADEVDNGNQSPEQPQVAPKGEQLVATQKSSAAPAVAKAPAASAKSAAPTQAAPASVPVKPVPAVSNFATDYLTTPSSSSRRRPGPSLSPFKDMAKQVKAPSGAR